MKEIKPRQAIKAMVKIPGSKSLSHRVLIAAALTKGKSRISNLLLCEDTRHTITALQEMGLAISLQEEDAVVSGTGGRFSSSQKIRTIYLGNSGTSFRLLLSTGALARGEYLFTGTPRLKERPVGELVRALQGLGVDIRCTEKENFPPVWINAQGIKGGKVNLTGKESSQYLSSLLLAAPYAQKDIEIEVEGELVSRPYVDLTLEVMEQFGIRVFREGYRTFKVPAGRGYRPCRYAVEGDASSASYFWAAAAVTGGTITTEPIRAQITRQGDIAFLDILEKMGCRVEKEASRVVVYGKTLSGIEADMSPMPDMVPTLAALALFAEGKTVIRNVSHLRIKESDRLHSLWQEWTRLGARIEERPDGLIITGNTPLRGACVNPHDDHRLAMSLAVVGLKVPGLQISDETCVQKSFPRFWELWERL